MQHFLSFKSQSTLPGALLLIALLIIGILVYQDFGISWDENVQRDMGLVSRSYIFSGDTTLNHYVERDHGVAFEVPLVMLEGATGITDGRDVYLLRHIVTHIVFLLGAFAGYVLTLRLFKKQWIAVLAFLMLAFHPRLYAHSFFNSKDIPLMVTFTLAFLAAQRVFAERSSRKAVLYLGLAVGFALSTRIVALVLVLPLTFFFVLDVIDSLRKKSELKLHIQRLLIFLVVAAVTMYLTWPALWQHPFASFAATYESMSHFRWSGHVLLMGEMLSSEHLPFYYLPVWVGITTPPVWLAFGIAGLLLVAFQFFRRPLAGWHAPQHRNMLLYAFSAVVPVGMVILLHSVVYDDWRHVYFIYPAIVMLAMYALDRLSGKWLWFATTAVVLQNALLLYDFVKLHPFEQVYFNRLVSRKEEALRANYELDYWAAGYKQALEYLIAQAPENEIKIAWGPAPLTMNREMLQQQDRPRIVFVNLEDADYFITNFRIHPEDFPYKTVVKDFRREGSTIIRIYKLR